jgi:PAS domain S-box-containing protein
MTYPERELMAQDSQPHTSDHARLASILDGIGDRFYAVDRDWKLTFFNRAAESFLGHRKEDVLGRSLWTVFPGLSGTVIGDAYREAMISRAEKRFETPSSVRPDEWLDVRVFPTPEGLGMSARDISDQRRITNELKANEEKLRIALAAAKLGEWERDLISGQFNTSQVCKANLGLQPNAELTFEMLQEMRHPEDQNRVTEAIRRAIAERTEYNVEYRVIWPDGSLHWLLARGHAVYDEQDRPVKMVGITTDVTEARLADSSLRASEALKGAILSASLDSIISIDQASRIVEWNTAAEQTFGYVRADVLGRDMAELIIPPEVRERHRAGMARYLSTGEGPVLGRRIEVEGLRSDGSRLPIELAISPLAIAGAPHFTAFIRDITERKRAEAAILESEQRLRATYEHASAGIAEVDEKGRFLRVNERFCLITGYSREELLSQTLLEITHPDDRHQDAKLLQGQITGELETYRLEKRYIHKSGQEVWIDLSASVVRETSGAFAYGIRVVEDITERKKADLRQRLLINELNHRVKNSLAVVQSIVAQSLRSSKVARPFAEELESRIIALANAHDVLTRSHWEAAELHAIVSSALRPHVREPSPFSVSGPPLCVKPKPALALSLAFHELATNAAKYGALSTPSGRVQVNWTVTDGRCFRLEWTEHGGPPVVRPARTGFGSRLIARSLAAELNGEVTLEYPEAGLTYVLEAPEQEVIELPE